MTATTTLEHVVDIEASPATVYDMWTTAAGLRAWWAQVADVDPQPGGAIRVDIDGDHIMIGEFVETHPPRRLVFTFGWSHGNPAPGSTRVEVTIDPIESGSRVTLRHHDLPLEHVEAHARGWTHFLGERMSDASSTDEA